MFQKSLIATLCLALVMVFVAPAKADINESIEAMQKKIAALEARVAELESLLAPMKDKMLAEARQQKLAQQARERMRLDHERFSSEQLQEIESLYQVANRNWQTDEARQSLKKLVDEYKNANRTGCAILYLGQMTKGEEKEAYLKQAIEDYSDCFYGDGVQVGAYARFHLAHYYHSIGKTENAQTLVDELKADYPDAITHQGQLLSDHYPG